MRAVQIQKVKNQRNNLCTRCLKPQYRVDLGQESMAAFACRTDIRGRLCLFWFGVNNGENACTVIDTAVLSGRNSANFDPK